MCVDVDLLREMCYHTTSFIEEYTRNALFRCIRSHEEGASGWIMPPKNQ